MTEATSLDHAIVRVTDAGVFYRASALGGCFRALWAARNGLVPKDLPESMQKIFAEGHRIEPIVLDRLRADGWEIYNEQKEVTVAIPGTDPPCYIVGHVDAYGVPPKGLNPADPEADQFEHVIEIKGFGKSNMDRFRQYGIKGFQKYHVQAGAYCVGSACGDIAFVVYDKDNDSYSTQFFTNDVTEWQLHALVLAVEEMTRIGTLPACSNEYPCPYYYIHDPKETPMPLDQLQSTMVDSYLAVDEQIKVLESAKKMIRDQIQESLHWAEGQPMSYSADHANVVVTANPQALDRPRIWELLRAAGEDPDSYLLPSSGYHIRINPIKKERTSTSADD